MTTPSHKSFRMPDIVPELNTGRLPSEFALALGRSSRVLARSADFVLVPSVSPLFVGHCLAFTRGCFSSVLEASRSQSGLFADLAGVQSQYENVFGPSVWFEHGVSSTSTNCGVTRAHQHLVPLACINPQSMIVRLAGELGAPERIERSSFETRDASSYLALGVASTEVLFWQSDFIPSQAVRKILAAQYDATEWDWKRLFGWQLVDQTIATWQAIHGLATEF